MPPEELARIVAQPGYGVVTDSTALPPNLPAVDDGDAGTSIEPRGRNKSRRAENGRLAIGSLTFGKMFNLHKYHCNDHDNGLPVSGVTQWTPEKNIVRVVYSCGCQDSETVEERNE